MYHSLASMRVRGEITKYKVLFQLVSQVVEYEFIICRTGNHGLSGGRGQAGEATGGEADHNEWSDVCFVEVINVGWFI